MLKDETRKKNQLYKRIYIKMRVKIKKKPLIWGKIRVFNWRVKLNWKIVVTKEKTNQKNNGQIEKKNKRTKTLIEWWN
jgi:hypothetical protein